MIFKVLPLIALLTGSTWAVGPYSSPQYPGARPAGGRVGGGGGGGGGAYRADVAYPPQPYDFDYDARDELGNRHYRQEAGDASGTVRGTYGYQDTQGLYRIVDYVADVNGFRANIRTNEPGVGEGNPADVVLSADPPPAGIYESFRRAGGGGGGGRYAGASPATARKPY